MNMQRTQQTNRSKSGISAAGGCSLLLLFGLLNCSSESGSDDKKAPGCEEGKVFCAGFVLTQCSGGQWTELDCAADCDANGYDLHGCLDYDNNGTDECVCKPRGTGGTGGSGGGETGGSGGGVTVGCVSDAECEPFLASASPPGCATARCDVALGVCVFEAVDGDGDQHPTQDCTLGSGNVETGNDCDDGDNNVYPGSEKTSCTAGVGECLRTGWLTCDGAKTTCTAVAGAPQPSDAPCDGKDYNCDGNPSTPPCKCIAGQTVTCNKGACNELVVSCDNGAFNCPAPIAAQEYCPDDDGDGYCTGSCASACSPPAGFKLKALCLSAIDCNDADKNINPGADEVMCNVKNDDCNSSTADQPPVGEACTTTYPSNSVCFAGTRQCEAGAVKCIATVAPSSEICDGKDNDCDGSIDENWPTLGQGCSKGIGECLRTGVNVCTTDHQGVTCNAIAGTPATKEACNGKDDNCNGRLDDAWFKKNGVVDQETVGAACYECVGVLGPESFGIDELINPDGEFNGNGPNVFARMVFRTVGSEICTTAHVVMAETAGDHSVGWDSSAEMCYATSTLIKMISPQEWPQASANMGYCIYTSHPNGGPCKACDLSNTACSKASWWLYTDTDHDADSGQWTTWQGTYTDGVTYDKVWGDYICQGDTTAGDDINPGSDGSSCGFGLSTAAKTCVWVEHTPPWPK